MDMMSILFRDHDLAQRCADADGDEDGGAIAGREKDAVSATHRQPAAAARALQRSQCHRSHVDGIARADTGIRRHGGVTAISFWKRISLSANSFSSARPCFLISPVG